MAKSLTLHDFRDLGAKPVSLSLDHFKDLGAQPIQKGDKTHGMQEKKEEIAHTDLLSRGLQFGRGRVEGIVGLADLTNRFVAAPLANVVGGISELTGGNPEPFYQARDRWSQSHLGEQAARGIDTLTGGRSEPRDALGHILNDTGSFSTPLPFIGKIAQAAGKTIPKVNMAENLAGAAGAATVLETTKDLFPDHPVTNLAKVIIGDIAGRKILMPPNQANQLAHSLEQFAQQLTKEKPNELKELAKKHNIQLPATVLSQNKLGNFLANNLVDSVFSSKAYDEIVEKANHDMKTQFLQTIRNGKTIEDIGNPTTVSTEARELLAGKYQKAQENVNTLKEQHQTQYQELLGPTDISPDIASQDTRSFLEKLQKDIHSKVNELYDNAEEYINPKETIKTPNLSKAMRDLKKSLKAPSPSQPARFVQSRISDIENVVFRHPKKVIQSLKEQGYPPDIIKRVLDALPDKDGKLSLRKAHNQLKALREDVKWGDVKGSKKTLERLISGLSKDIEAGANAQYLDAIGEANHYFKQNEVDRIRTDLAQSMLRDEMPIQAYSKMSSVTGIRELEKILGDTKNATDILGALKQAKVNELLRQPFEKDPNWLYKNLKKGLPIVQKDLLAELMGKQKFNRLTQWVKQIDHPDLPEQFKTTLFQALVTQNVPRDAYEYMKNSRYRQPIQKLLSQFPEGKEILSQLDAALIEETLTQKVIKNNELSYANLETYTTKGLTKQNLLKDILGTDRYKKLQELGQIAHFLNASNKNMAQPSKSAVRGKDLVMINTLVMSILSGSWKTAAATAGTMGGVHILSRILAKPHLLDKTLQLTRAYKKRNLPKVETLAKQIINGLQYGQPED